MPISPPVGLALAAAFAVVTAGAATFGRMADRRFPEAGMPVLAASRDACPLTPAQTRKAVEAFEEMMPVLMHPRCLNCHGGVDPFVEPSEGSHVGGKMDSRPRRIAQCQECHDGLPGWDVPVDVMFFVGKSARELCMLFKRTEPDGARFVGHIEHENGGIQFVEMAFRGDRALNEGAKSIYQIETGRALVIEPPPGTHRELVAQAQAWADAVGAGWTVMPDCGCKPTSGAWVGTVNVVFVLQAAELGTVTETLKSTVRLEIDSSFTDDPAQYFKSVSGTIKWHSQWVGKCSANASGTVPIGIGADDNPMAMMHVADQTDGNGTRYNVSLGPWPDQYQPRFIVRCGDSHSFPGLLYGLGNWWNHPVPGMVSPDGKTLKGSYQAQVGPSATEVWEWDLRLVEE